MNDENISRVAFLDSNTLHYIRLYLSHAKENNFYPFGNNHDLTNLRSILGSGSDSELAKALKRGLETVRYIAGEDRIEHVEYAAVSELELLSGMARGKALIKTAGVSPPHRMWTRVQEKYIHDLLSSADLCEVRSSVDELTSLLEDSAIAVRSDHRERTRDVVELAKDIASLLYMEPMDVVIYASALIAQADYFFTSDRYLRKTVNDICNGRSPRFREINQRLKECINHITKWPADKVVLASAHQINADGTQEPELQF